MSQQQTNNGLEVFRRALCDGKPQVAVAEFQRLIGEADAPEDLAGEVAPVLATALDDFHVVPVTSFAAWLRNFPLDDLVQQVLEPVAAELEKVRHWATVFEEITEERMARDIRSLIRERDTSGAEELARRFIAVAEDPKERGRRARHLGAILGSLDHDRPRVEKVLSGLEKNAAEAGLSEAMLEGLRETLEKSRQNLTVAEMSQRERQWDRAQTDAVVELMRALPGRVAVRNPSPEEEQKVYDAFHAFVAAYYTKEEAFDFADLARVLREFCPTDPRSVGPVEGVEDVAFLRMNPAAKLASVRSLRALGKKKRLIQSVLDSVRVPRERKTLEALVKMMGGLSNSEFYPYLSRALEERKLERLRPVIVDSLGRLGDPRSLGTLLDLYESACRANVIDPPTRARISNIVAALGRIARHPNTPADQRNDIVRRVFRRMPDDRTLGRQVIENLCTFNPSGLSEDNRKQAIGHAIDGLWTQDPRSNLEKPVEGETSELGFRKQMSDLLVSMGSEAVPIIVTEADRHAMNYSGAYIALGETLSEIGDERALPLLQKMLLNTLTTNESAIPEQMRETIYDPETNRYVALSKDRVAYSLVYAIHKAGGEKGKVLLTRLTDRIRSEQVEAPGARTMQLLGQLIVGRGGQATKPPGADRKNDRDGLDDAAGDGQPRPRQDESLKALLKDIRGKGLFGVKIAKRVGAIQEVAARRETEAIQALCEALQTDDMAVKTAAETALRHLVRPTDPPRIFHLALVEVLEALRAAPDEGAEAIASFASRLKPDRDPLRSLLLKYVKMEADETMRRRLGRIFQKAEERSASGEGAALEKQEITIEAGNRERVPGEVAMGHTDAPAPGGGADGSRKWQTTTEVESKYELKRRYLEERRAWIAGGKVGDEPKRPKGI